MRTTTQPCTLPRLDMGATVFGSEAPNQLRHIGFKPMEFSRASKLPCLHTTATDRQDFSPSGELGGYIASIWRIGISPLSL